MSFKTWPDILLAADASTLMPCVLGAAAGADEDAPGIFASSPVGVLPPSDGDGMEGGEAWEPCSYCSGSGSSSFKSGSISLSRSYPAVAFDALNSD